MSDRGEKPRGVAAADLRRVTACSQALDEVRRKFEASIRDARASGETLRDIANAAGLSHQRVWQILNQKDSV